MKILLIKHCSLYGIKIVCSHGNHPLKVSTFIQDMDERIHLLTDEKQKFEAEEWKNQRKVNVHG